MKNLLFIFITLITIANVSYASFPVEKSYSQQSVVFLPLAEQVTDDYLDPEPAGFCNNFVSFKIYIITYDQCSTYISSNSPICICNF